MHVTLKLRRDVPSLRRRAEHAALVDCFRAARASDGFRLVHFSVQVDHVHLLCEARDRPSLSRAMHALAIRIAKRLDALWKRRGPVFADRHHDRILRSPREVRNALAYVLDNARKHGAMPRRDVRDPYSSAEWLDGAGNGVADSPVQPPRTWLLAVGWRRHGVILLGEVARRDRAPPSRRLRA